MRCSASDHADGPLHRLRRPSPRGGTELHDRHPHPRRLAADLVDLLDVEEIDTDLYRGRRSHRRGRPRVRRAGDRAGAAGRAALDRGPQGRALAPRLFHARRATRIIPIIYRVVRDFDGKSFATRRVIAMQRGAADPQHGGLVPDAGGRLPPSGRDARRARCPRRWKPRRRSARARSRDIPEERFRAQLTRAAPDRDPPGLSAQMVRSRPRPTPIQHSWFRAVAPLGRRSRDAPRGPRLCQRHGAARHLHAAARRQLDDAGLADRQPRPRAVAARAVPRRRMAALRHRQPLGGPRARDEPRADLHPRRPPGRERRAGGTDPDADAEADDA